MNELWNTIKSLFKSAEASTAQQPLIHELIKRTETELIDYENWKDSLACRRLLDWLNNQHAEFLIQPKSIDRAIDFLNTPSSKGFVIHFNLTNHSKTDVQHFFDLLKEKVLALPYRSYVSETKTYNKADWVENCQRHYLKPKTNHQALENLEQQYGNINIELILRNDKVWNLKFSATSYNDRLYKKAGAFDELMGHLSTR